MLDKPAENLDYKILKTATVTSLIICFSFNICF